MVLHGQFKVAARAREKLQWKARQTLHQASHALTGLYRNRVKHYQRPAALASRVIFFFVEPLTCALDMPIALLIRRIGDMPESKEINENSSSVIPNHSPCYLGSVAMPVGSTLDL